MEIDNTLFENLDYLGSWGILTTDVSLRITGWNRWLEKHSGKLAESVLGQPLLEVFPDLAIRSLDRYFRQALQGQSGVLSQRFHAYLLPFPPTVAAPSLMHMQQTAKVNPLMVGGEIAGTLTLIEDVTERFVTEQELRLQAQQLEEANRHKDEFLAMLAHELRNPLAPISHGVRVLDFVAANSDEARETRSMIERQVGHMSRLIDDLLDVSRIVRRKVRLQTEPLDIADLLREVAHDYAAILADSGLTLQTDLPSEPCWMEGDRIRLAQVVTNLLHNANKFTDSGGQIRLSAQVQCEQKQALITVEDDGIGMSPETLSKVFDTFSQADSSLARSKGGLGIGLSLVKGLAELHGGAVEAHSDGLGKGSRFHVRLPLTEPAAKADSVQAAPQFQPRSAKRVLIVEDNRDTAASLQRLLTHLGFEAETAHSGKQGIQCAISFLPEVVLCDLGLPDIDGFAVAQSLRENADTRGSLLIAQSGYGQAEDIRRAIDAGFDFHLIKPIDLDQLLKMLKAPRESSDL